MLQFSYLYREMEAGDRFKKWTSLKMAVIFIMVLLLLQCKSGTGKYTAGELAEIVVTKEYYPEGRKVV